MMERFLTPRVAETAMIILLKPFAVSPSATSAKWQTMEIPLQAISSSSGTCHSSQEGIFQRSLSKSGACPKVAKGQDVAASPR